MTGVQTYALPICLLVAAASFGGGGHKKAAGATLQIPMEAAVHAVEQHVARALANKVP